MRSQGRSENTKYVTRPTPKNSRLSKFGGSSVEGGKKIPYTPPTISPLLPCRHSSQWITAMLPFKTLVLSVAPLLITTSSRRPLPSVAALTMSTSTNTSQECNGKSAVIFLHGLGDTPAGWSSLQRNLPSIRPKLGMDVHYVFPPAPTVSITINGGMQMPGWFDLYDWPIGVSARDDRDGKIAAAQQIEQVRRTV